MAGVQGEFTFDGVGLFTGVDCAVRVQCGVLAEPGIWVSRRDKLETRVRANISNVTESPALPNVPAGFPVRNTTLILKDGSPVATVEHLLSALAAAGIWNALIEVTGPEIPILDGSSLPIAELVSRMGGVQGSQTRHWDQGGVEPLRLHKPIVLQDKHAQIEVVPRNQPGTLYSYTLDFTLQGHIAQASELGHQHAQWVRDGQGGQDQEGRGTSWEAYVRDVAPARTFSFEHEANAAHGMGLFRRFTPRDLPVIAPDGTLIENAWREPPAFEPARHKLLDLIGDLALMGRPIQADIFAKSSGHALNRQLCREILAQASRGA